LSWMLKRGIEELVGDALVIVSPAPLPPAVAHAQKEGTAPTSRPSPTTRGGRRLPKCTALKLPACCVRTRSEPERGNRKEPAATRRRGASPE
jgi:hypothetical protein